MRDEYILEMRDIVKEFPGVKALDGVQLKVRPGTVHTLMGENGAGKSTLMKCLIGIYQPTSGTIIFNGKKVQYTSTLQAMKDGISMIPQEMSPVLERSVCENVWMGREMKKGILLDYKRMYKECRELFDRLNLQIDPNSKMKELTCAKMQMVEIAKAISHNSKIVIMDEPTSALTENEVEELFRIIADLKSKGVAIIYISHKMEEIFRISDEITIFRDGKYIYSDLAKNLDIDTVIKYMVGRKVTDMFPKVKCDIGETVFRVENLSYGNIVKNLSFELHKGEILGFAGLVGAGRTEAMEAIFGIRKKTSGRIFKDGKEINIQSPSDAIAHGIGMLTEDRRGSGIVGLMCITDNVTIASWKKYGFPMKHKKMRDDTLQYIERIKIKTPSEKTRIMNLSGGNQQKVLWQGGF
ncbi:MAG: sugar ABC transporter ATP-binding protein [Acetivibrionales bacterium]